MLEPGRTVTRVDAVVLAGGSAFGLAAADGVMRLLAERGQGFPTAGGPVPIVPAACVFDLVDADSVRPGADGRLRGGRRGGDRLDTDRSRSARGGARPSGSGAVASTRSRAASAQRARRATTRT